MFSALALQHIQAPRFAGAMADATHVGVSGQPGGGPFIKLYLLVDEGTISRVSYECNGCPSSMAASGVMAQLLTGRTLEKARQLEVGDFTAILGDLPEGKGYYAEMAVEAVRDAIRDQRGMN